MNSIEQTRAQLLLDYLFIHQNEKVPLETLKRMLHSHPSGNHKVDDNAICKAIGHHPYLIPSGFEVHISTKEGKYAILEQVTITLNDERRGRYPELKSDLGFALWKWLFNVDFAPDVDFTHNAVVVEKVAMLRELTAAAVLVDAGSTTTRAIQSLLTLPEMPIKIGGSKDSTKPGQIVQPRFITPTIVSNAPAIINAVSKSKHATTIPLWIIGGVFHPELWSICGSMAEQSLQSWGAWKAEISIIGTTRCFNHPSGTLGFACDNRNEAQLKARLLQMGFLRIILMDSSKLKGPHTGHLFVPLSSSSVDAVIIDDGKLTGAHESVNAFRVQARAAGVAVVTVKTAEAKVKKGKEV